MKVQHAEQHVLGSHGLAETKAFHIRTNAHAFKLLSSGLYSDKIAAVVREIGCNAADAHVEYGTPDRPIIVKLPNRIDNQFYIRDYGPGLSHEDVMNLYTTYFASTKQNSNDFTGAFGLGSKSPFSYTDQFTVISVHGGIKRTYSAYLDNQGSPTISKLAELPADADWSHGVQIGFPVKAEDFGRFEATAQTIYRWFKVTPQIEGARGITPLVSKTSHPLFEFHRNVGVTLGAVMGNVFYPIDVAKLSHNYTTGLFSFVQYFPGIVLKLNIGDVQVAASREELQYDPETIKFLRERLAEVLKYIAEDIAKKLASAKTWEERTVAKEFTKNWTSNMWMDTWVKFFDLAGLKDSRTLAGLATTDSILVPAFMGKNTIAKILKPGYGGRSHIRSKRVVMGVEEGFTASAKIDLRPQTKVYYGKQNKVGLRAKELFKNGVDQILFFTAEKVKDAQAEAREVADFLGIKDITDIITAPLPVGYVPPKRTVKSKNAHLQPLPSLAIKLVQETGSSADISKLKPKHHNFMVVGSKSYHTVIRVYEKSMEEDKLFEHRDWNELWKNIRVLIRKIPAPFDGYVELRAVEVSKLDLVKRGWKTTYHAAKEWLTNQTTRDAIAKEAMGWKPSIDISPYHKYGWAGELIYMKEMKPDAYKLVRPFLDTLKLARPVDEIHKASKDNGGGKEPIIISAYRTLAGEFGLPAITVPKPVNYVSIEDFDNDLKQRFPISNTLDSGVFRSVYWDHPDKAEGFLKLIFS